MNRTPLCQIQGNTQISRYEKNKSSVLESSFHMNDTQYSEEWNLNQRILTLQKELKAVNEENEKLENEILRLNNVEHELDEQITQNEILIQRYIQLKK